MPTGRPTKVKPYLKTDVGMVREHNEDSAAVDPEASFFIVADGMGGHAAGEVASAMAVEEVEEALKEARAQISAFAESPTDDGRRALVGLLESSVQRAHQAVFDRGSREADKKGMGTTLEVVLIAGGEAFVAHVGDSRTYLVRGTAAAQVTTDHTVAEVLVIEGKLTPEEARLSPLRTILVNAIGVSPDVGVELAHIKLRRGDKLLLCSDGLHDYYPSDLELAQLLTESGGEDAITKLVELAKERGGHDNITGILVEVIEGNPTVEEEEAEARRLAAELEASQSSEDRSAVPIVTNATEPTQPMGSETADALNPGGEGAPATVEPDGGANVDAEAKGEPEPEANGEPEAKAKSE